MLRPLPPAAYYAEYRSVRGSPARVAPRPFVPLSKNAKMVALRETG